MTNAECLLLFFGMFLVTYIPRAIQSVLVGRVKYGKYTEKFLRLIPYTAMASLIFPGVMIIDCDPIYGILGALTAGILAWFKCPVMVSVLCAIGVEFLLYTLL